MPVTGTISNISRGSLHDGRGIRTVVYFKGCALRCAWCHNPETLDVKPEILRITDKCVRCGKCIAACHVGCYRIEGDDLIYDRANCTRCGRCAEVCPGGALTLCGEKKTAEQVFAEVVKDEHYYRESGGGVTLSGGECLLQPEFCRAVLSLCRKADIHTAIETALFCDRGAIDSVLPLTDFVFADLKIADSHKHKRYTGQGNEKILQNLKYVTSLRSTTVRIPVIPSVNDSAEDMAAFGEIIRGLGEYVTGVELLRYNSLAESKYAFVGRKYRGFAAQPQENGQMDNMAARLRKSLKDKCEVFYR